MSVIFETDLKRKGASPPVSARNMRFLTGQLALFRFKWQKPDANAFRLINSAAAQPAGAGQRIGRAF